MAIDEIRKWLNSGNNYESGVQLYIKYGRSDNYKTILKKQRNSSNRVLLFDLLKQLYKELKHPEEPVTIMPTAPAAVPSGTAKVESNTIPPINQSQAYSALDAEWRAPYYEANMLFSRLDLINNEVEREQACLKILALEDTFCEIWKRMEYLVKHGELLPDQQALPAKEVNNMQRQLNNLRTYITKAQKKLPTLDGSKLLKKQKQIEEWKSEVSKLGLIVSNG